MSNVVLHLPKLVENYMLYAGVVYTSRNMGVQITTPGEQFGGGWGAGSCAYTKGGGYGDGHDNALGGGVGNGDGGASAA